MRPFIQFSSRFIQKSNEYYLAFKIKDESFAANFPKIVGFSKSFTCFETASAHTLITHFAKIGERYLPILNLSKKLGFEASTELAVTPSRIVIFETELYDNKIEFAIAYDELGEAFEIGQDKIETVQNDGSAYENIYVKGVHVHNKECMLIINIDKLIDIDDLIDIKVLEKQYK
ncbi:MAG TPA: chemotaxis protein CheW [Bacteroidales bacterium]|nr:chemotaxis protein CheW [Bacteroidales bacterium]